MADIITRPLFRHLRSEPTNHTLYFRQGALKRSGAGLSFWFRPTVSAVAEVPLDDQDLSFVFHGRSFDFQDITVQGTVSWRIADAQAAASRIDFTLDLASGEYRKQPLQYIDDLLTQLAQQQVWDYLVTTPLDGILREGVDRVRALIRTGLGEDTTLIAMGITPTAIRVSAINPQAEVERALQLPTREAIQQHADEATFARRAQAVEKERAISENELQTQIELARRQSALVEQEGSNQRARSEEDAAAKHIAAEAERGRARLLAESEAERVELATAAEARGIHLTAKARSDEVGLVEGARVTAERDRAGIYEHMSPEVLIGLALQELAGNLHTIEHLNITPEMLTPLLSGLLDQNKRAS